MMNNDNTECFTMLPNSVMDWLIGSEHALTPRQWQIMLLVFRYTYGFQRKSAALSSRFVSKATGIDQGDVVRAFKALVERGYLTVSYDRKIGYYTMCPRKYKNKQIHEYGCADDGVSPSRWCLTPETDGDLPSKIKRKEQKDRGVVSPSSLENEFRDILARHNVPIAEQEYPFKGWFFDFAWPEQRIAVEIDGGMHTGSSHLTAEGHQNDAEKSNAAAADGWTVLRLTADLMRSAHSLNTVIRILLQRLSPDAPLPAAAVCVASHEQRLAPWLYDDTLPRSSKSDVLF